MGAAVVRGKQNNFRISALRDCLLGWNELCGDMQRFLLA
jgi:hypothetical protein